MRHRAPFAKTVGGLHATAVMLSFYGARHEVCHLLQRLSHTTRAFVVEQKGIPGFVVYHPPTVLEWLKDMQIEDMLAANLNLHKINDSDAFVKTLAAMKDNQEVEAHVKKNHPILLIEFLKASKKDEQLMEFCKGLRDDYKLYTFYIQHYLLPWFESLRRGGRLKKGNNAHFK